MTSNDAVRILQHAAFYIFSTRVAGGPGKTMRGSVEVWQAMVMLDQCRSELLRVQIASASPSPGPDKESRSSLFGRIGVRRNVIATLMLCC